MAKRKFTLQELAVLTTEERLSYQDDLIPYRELLCVLDTSFKEGLKIGRKQEKIAIIFRCLEINLALEVIANIVRLSVEEVRQLIENQQKQINKILFTK